MLSASKSKQVCQHFILPPCPVFAAPVIIVLFVQQDLQLVKIGFLPFFRYNTACHSHLCCVLHPLFVASPPLLLVDITAFFIPLCTLFFFH